LSKPKLIKSCRAERRREKVYFNLGHAVAHLMEPLRRKLTGGG